MNSVKGKCSLKSQGAKPVLFSNKGNELSLSSASLIELMRAVLAKGAPFRFCAKGFSMSPFIRDGDVVTVSPIGMTPLQRGDVIAFVRPETGRLVVHRIIDEKSDGYLIKGDNSSELDGLIAPVNVLGKVTNIERDGKKILIGRGPEKYLIVYLSRHNLLQPTIYRARRVLHPVLRRQKV